MSLEKEEIIEQLTKKYGNSIADVFYDYIEGDYSESEATDIIIDFMSQEILIQLQQTEKLREEIEELKESRQKFAIESTSRLEKLKNIEEQLHYIAFGNYNSIQEVSDELQQTKEKLKRCEEVIDLLERFVCKVGDRLERDNSHFDLSIEADMLLTKLKYNG